MKQFLSFGWKFAIFLLLTFAAYWWIYVPRWVYTNGVSATARVVEVWNTGNMVNEAPLGGVRLEVMPISGDTYQVKKYCRVSFGSDWLFSEGNIVNVKYNPGFPPRVVLTDTVCDLENASIITIPVTVLGSILLTVFVANWILKTFMISDLSNKGEFPSATVLSNKETGWTLNDKPGVKLELKVYPPGDNSYQTTSVQVVEPSDLSLLYPGREVKVKYDPSHRNRLKLVSIGEHKAVNTSERLERLEEIYNRRLISEEEYLQLREGILKSI
jgi:hypothetical protein